MTNTPSEREIFDKGKLVALLREKSPSAPRVERWVSTIAKEARAHLTWHYAGGRVCIVHLGDAASYQRVVTALWAHNGEASIRIISVEPFTPR